MTCGPHDWPSGTHKFQCRAAENCCFCLRTGLVPARRDVDEREAVRQAHHDVVVEELVSERRGRDICAERELRHQRPDHCGESWGG